MRIVRTIRSLQRWRKTLQQRTIGFVATMGALHQGHRTLIGRARRSCDTVVVSLFVNPLQFGPTEDFQRYPRNLKKDITLCREEGIDVLFVPTLQDLYPLGFQTSVNVPRLSKAWEGESRPTHFEGVATVVTKLLNLVRPNTTFFGQKDFQQILVVKQLVKDLNMDVNIVMCPTIREPDGLAYSSRNTYLNPLHRPKATILYHALRAGQNAMRHGERSGRTVQQIMKKRAAKEPGIKVDYLAPCHPETLEPLGNLKGKVVLLGSMRVGTIRLIDNLLLMVPTIKSR